MYFNINMNILPSTVSDTSANSNNNNNNTPSLTNNNNSNLLASVSSAINNLNNCGNNHSQTINDDIILTDLDFFLMNNNNNNQNNESNKSTSNINRNNVINTNYNIQRPPPLTTPATLHSFINSNSNNNNNNHHNLHTHSHFNHNDSNNNNNHLINFYNTTNSTFSLQASTPNKPHLKSNKIAFNNTKNQNSESQDQNNNNHHTLDLNNTYLDNILLDDYLTHNLCATNINNNNSNIIPAIQSNIALNNNQIPTYAPLLLSQQNPIQLPQHHPSIIVNKVSDNASNSRNNKMIGVSTSSNASSTSSSPSSTSNLTTLSVSSSNSSRKRPMSRNLSNTPPSKLLNNGVSKSPQSTTANTSSSSSNIIKKLKEFTSGSAINSLNHLNDFTLLNPYEQQFNSNTNNASNNMTSSVSASNNNNSSINSKYKRYDDLKCWICGDTSSGNHYGALTCEACKLFFRRHSNALNGNINTNSSNSINNNSNPSTSSISSSSSPNNNNNNSNNTINSENAKLTQCAQRNCIITVATRSQCPECRYRKCIAVGMGLNRTTFGRHTSSQKIKYNIRVNDLFGEIKKLFDHLTVSLENKNPSSDSNEPFNNLLIPNDLIRKNSSKFKTVKNIKELENSLINFYNSVLNLMRPQQLANLNINTVNYISTNLLVSFCLIFGYNIILNDNKLSSFYVNHAQVKHILEQIKQIESQFNTFALRVKIIYYLLIMHSSYNVDNLENSNLFASPSSSNETSMKLLNPSSSASSSSSSSSSSQNEEDLIANNEINIQRTFLDLLNSELDFQQNTVASARVSLLLKLDHFI